MRRKVTGRAGAKDTGLVGDVAAQHKVSTGKGTVDARSCIWMKQQTGTQAAVPAKGLLVRSLLSSRQTPLKITRTPVHSLLVCFSSCIARRLTIWLEVQP